MEWRLDVLYTCSMISMILFFFREENILPVSFTQKLLISYTASCNFWLASYQQIVRSKTSSGSDFPYYLGILATINKTAVCLPPHQMERVLHATPMWSLRPPLDMVLQFLTTLYEEGLGYSAINTARSALSAVVILPDNKTVGCHRLVIWFLKRIFEPWYNETWGTMFSITPNPWLKIQNFLWRN